MASAPATRNPFSNDDDFSSTFGFPTRQELHNRLAKLSRVAVAAFAIRSTLRVLPLTAYGHNAHNAFSPRLDPLSLPRALEETIKLFSTYGDRAKSTTAAHPVHNAAKAAERYAIRVPDDAAYAIAKAAHAARSALVGEGEAYLDEPVEAIFRACRALRAIESPRGDGFVMPPVTAFCTAMSDDLHWLESHAIQQGKDLVGFIEHPLFARAESPAAETYHTPWIKSLEEHCRATRANEATADAALLERFDRYFRDPWARIDLIERSPESCQLTPEELATLVARLAYQNPAAASLVETPSMDRLGALIGPSHKPTDLRPFAKALAQEHGDLLPNRFWVAWLQSAYPAFFKTCLPAATVANPEPSAGKKNESNESQSPRARSATARTVKKTLIRRKK